MNNIIKDNKIGRLIFMFTALSIILSCTEDKKMRTGGPYYFESFEAKQQADFPIRPVRLISKEKASQLKAYGVAYYDNKGRIIVYSKMLEGKIDWSSKYFYNLEGYLEKEEYLKPEGITVYRYYDKKGNFLKEEPKSDASEP